MIAMTTVNSLLLAVAATGLLLYGRTRLLPVSAAGVLVLLAELEAAWNKHHLTIEIAAALTGLALLAAFELRSWAEELAATPSDREAYRARARELALRLGAIAALLAVLILLGRGVVHGPALGILGGLGAVFVGAGLIWLAARPGGRR
jgi:hypothetical protein